MNTSDPVQQSNVFSLHSGIVSIFAFEHDKVKLL